MDSSTPVSHSFGLEADPVTSMRIAPPTPLQVLAAPRHRLGQQLVNPANNDSGAEVIDPMPPTVGAVTKKPRKKMGVGHVRAPPSFLPIAVKLGRFPSLTQEENYQ